MTPKWQRGGVRLDPRWAASAASLLSGVLLVLPLAGASQHGGAEVRGDDAAAVAGERPRVGARAAPDIEHALRPRRQRLEELEDALPPSPHPLGAEPTDDVI